MTEPFVRKSVKILSPLRYPGAKRRLGPYLSEVLKLNSLTPKLFVEPFAGSASVALQMAHGKDVEKIALGEKDPLVASFWKVVFRDVEWLKSEIRKIPLTVEKWKYFKYGKFRTQREQALACLYLNRTSFSGILAPQAGPIGGYKQNSEYDIGCRFNVETLVRRLDQAAELKDKILFIENMSWEKVIDKVESLDYTKKEVFFYFDPPFFHKADKLYRYYFEESDHQELHDRLMKLKYPWFLSYDIADSIIKKYSKNGAAPRRLGILYSSGRFSTGEELIMTNQKNVPPGTRLWRETSEWKTK
ncbi:MAG: DNA adenine methylase [Acidobacteria bacterium]|nr:DNA adenine methylase [Acidobacteriota bacterium]